MTRRRVIERRTRFFLGCEGESEQAYGVFLQRMADVKALSVHIVAINLQPAGDPLAIAEKAVRAFNKEERKAKFAGKAILLDADRLTEHEVRGRHAVELLAQEGFTAVWQRPDHEGLLLRHFSGHERSFPQRGRSMAALQRIWPAYHKNMAAVDLQKTLSIEHLKRAAGTTPEFRELLVNIGIASA